MNDTTRRYPRTLDEAFRTPRYADPLERYPRTGYPTLWWIALYACTIVTLALVWGTA